MVIHHPRPAPNAPWAIEEYYTDDEREMFRRWETAMAELPERQWWQFWRSNPTKMLMMKWRTYEHSRYMDSIAPPPPDKLSRPTLEQKSIPLPWPAPEPPPPSASPLSRSHA